MKTPAQAHADAIFRHWGKKNVDHAGKFLSVEDLYLAFKTRLMQELATDTHGTSHYGLLVDKPTGDVER